MFNILNYHYPSANSPAGIGNLFCNILITLGTAYFINTIFQNLKLAYDTSNITQSLAVTKASPEVNKKAQPNSKQSLLQKMVTSPDSNPNKGAQGNLKNNQSFHPDFKQDTKNVEGDTVKFKA